MGLMFLVGASWDDPVGHLFRGLHVPLAVRLEPEPIARGLSLAGLVGLVFFLRYRFRRHWDGTHSADLAPGKPLLDGRLKGHRHNREILLAMQSISARYDSAAVAIFGEILTNPGAHHVRVTDHVEPLGECLRITVSTTFALPPARPTAPTGNRPPVVLIPFIKATKGTMLDNIDTSDASGASVPFLSQRETRGLIALVLRGLFEEEYRPADGEQGKKQRDALWRLLRLACQQGRVSKEDVERQFNAVLDRLDAPKDSDRARKLRRICTFFALNYVIVAEVASPPGTKYVLRYSKTIPLYGRAESRRLSWRVRFGLRAYRFIVPVNLAFTADSYHFRMTGGQNWYVRSHYLLDGDTFEPVTQDELRKANGPVYLRVRHRQALPYAHLYVRGTSVKDKQVNLATVVEFGEIPPGALGVTFAVAAVAALLIMFLALFVPRLEGSFSGDVLALLLSLPPVAATFVGYSIDTVQRSSLSTLLGLVLAGATSIMTAALYVRPAPPWLLLHEPVLFGVLRPHSINVLVLMIGLVAVCNAVHLYWRLRAETSHYLDLLKAKNSLAMMFR